jgi:hypothetical protein
LLQIATRQVGQRAIFCPLPLAEGVVWILHRNTNPKFPASHTIEIVFNQSADIANVPGMLMRVSDEARGTALAGLAVKVKQASFLMGLSPTDLQQNIKLLKERPWVDIPLVYSKGEIGNRLVTEAFLSWAQ